MDTIVAAAAALTSIVLLAGACQGEGQFSDAPKARAPDEPMVQEGGQPKAASDESGMPQGHPPVGGAQKRAKTGASRGGGSRPRRKRGSGRGAGPSAGTTGDGASKMPVDWEMPSSWREVEPSSSMRDAQYEVSGAEGDDPATLAVFHFPGGAGGVDRNIDRWIGQFEGADRGSGAEVETRTVDGLKVHVVDATGTYSPGMGPGGGSPRENYRLLGAVVETRSGSVFLKLVGPESTVDGAETDFEDLISSLESRM